MRDPAVRHVEVGRIDAREAGFPREPGFVSAALIELGIEVLSRDSTAEPLVVAGLDELVVQVDWFAARKGARLSRPQLGELLAERAAGPAPLGVMLHHAVMDTAEFEGVGEMLGVLTGNPNVAMRSMAEIAHGMKLTKGSTR